MCSAEKTGFCTLCYKMVLTVKNEYFQGRTCLNKDIVKELNAIIILKVIGEDCNSATWIIDAKHGEGTITLNEPGLDKLNKYSFT